MKNTKTKLLALCIIYILSLALPSQAATVTELQATINALIAQVTALQAQLAILQSSTSSSLPLNCAGITFNRPLLQGSYGNDVKCLQTLLNRNTDTRIANSGPGSLGQETYYFGYLTKLAVIRLQNKYASEILTPSRLTYGTGIVGPSTRTKLNTICSSFTTTVPPVTTPATTPIIPATGGGGSTVTPTTTTGGGGGGGGGGSTVIPTSNPATDTDSPVRSNSTPSGTLTAGTTQATISLSTNELATCKYSLTAGTSYSSMTGTFTATGGTNHSKTITGLSNGTSYTYYVRCTDAIGNINTSDYTISFSVSSPSCVDCGLGNPTIAPTSPISNTSFTITCPANNTGYDCINAYSNGSSNKCTYSSWSGNNVIFNCTGLTTGSYTSRCEAITGTSRNCCAASKTGSYSVQTIADTTVPTRSGGSPSGTLTAGTTQTTISLSTNESATCKYSLTAGTAYASMTGTFTATGGTTHSKTITGLTNGTGYVYYVRCTDSSNNVNTSDYSISFSVSSPSVTTGITLTSPNGGETWQRGTTHTITWNYTGSPGPYAKIALLKAGTEVGTIIASTTIGSSGTGSFTWDISASTSLSTGSDMAVSVQSISQSTVKDASNAYFTLTPAAVSDTTPPNQITNLSASNLAQTSVTLTWAAPGDDGTVGTATSYDIRYSTASITSSNWTSATQASGEPTPSTSGTSQSFTVTGLAANTTYYFAIKAIDDAGNVSILSNVVPGKTLAGSLSLTGIQIFPKDHIYNTKVDNLSVDAKSDIYINSLISETTGKLRHYISNAIPYNVVDSSTPHTTSTTGFLYNGAYSDNIAYPVPKNAFIEKGCTDYHLCIVDVDEMKLYELGGVVQNADGTWKANNGSVWDLTGYRFRLEKNNNQTPMWAENEAGVPNLPGLVRYDEVSSGHIDHLLILGIPLMQNTWVWPARAAAPLPGFNDTMRPPGGQRFRLKASYDISGFPPQAKVILQTLKTYGGMVATNNGTCSDGSIRKTGSGEDPCPFPLHVLGSFSVIGSPDSRWNFNTDINTLYNVPISAFEAVDVSPLIIDINSAQARTNLLLPLTSITVKSPNGGETWQRGTTHTVTWTYTGGSPESNVKIALLKAGVEIGTIIAGTPLGSNGTGSYVWNISADTSLSIGSDMAVSVQSVNQPTVKDASNAYFTLIPAAVSDTTAPSQITNLSASNLTQNSATLTFTTPGDDGTTGKATSYDVRYSTASITSSNWTSATAASGEPTPSTSGTSQTFTVTGLPANTTYYFAIKAIDDANNSSVLSNVVSGKTSAATSLTLEDVQIFPKDSAWNTRVDNLPVDSKSNDYITGIMNDTTGYLDHYIKTAVPYNIVHTKIPPITLSRYLTSITSKEYSDDIPYPIPDNPLFEQGSGDHHMEIIDVDETVLYELGVVKQATDGSWSAGSACMWDLKGYAFRKNNETPMWSGSESGLPHTPGLIRYDEVSAGYIDHAIMFGMPAMSNTWIWPARAAQINDPINPPVLPVQFIDSPQPLSFDPKYNGSPRTCIYSFSNCALPDGHIRPPAGQRFRLKSSYDISGFPPQAKVILQALKTYGMMAGTNSGWYTPSWKGGVGVIGSPDARWNWSDVNTIKNVPLSAFEAVDVTPIMTDLNSQQTRTPIYPPSGAFIKVSSPSGGETWKLGSSYTVKWTYSSSLNGTDVRISLFYKGTEKPYGGHIIERTPIGTGGIGSYTWTINPYLTWSSKLGANTTLKDFQVSIQDLTYFGVRGMSTTTFTITP